MTDFTLPVTSVQRFCMHDGAGVRTTVFLKGCPMKCPWCHNPEARTSKNVILYETSRCIGCAACAVCPSGAHTFEDGVHNFDRAKCTVCGACIDVCPTKALEKCHRDMTVGEIVREVLRDKPFYTDGGGVTLSGGEPMFHGEKTLELLEVLKEAGLNTAVETCGCFDKKLLDRAVKSVDTFLWDFKDSDEKRHLENTGVPLEIVTDNLKYADALGAKTVLRCIIIEGVNFTKEHLENIKKLVSSLANCIGAELLEYHPMADSKCLSCGADPSFHNSRYIPDREKLESARRFVRGEGDFFEE